MTLHHRIWELVSTISHPRRQKPISPAETAATTNANRAKNLEAEISRLTWTVLDGQATEAQRRRLADLVNAQHEARRA